MTTLTATDTTTVPDGPVGRTDPPGLLPIGVVHPAGRARPVDASGAATGAPRSAVQDVLDAEAWPVRPADMWTRVQRDRALARFTRLNVLVTDHGCVVARTPAGSRAGAGTGRERWPPPPAAA
jgi:hypothetical protein